MKRRAKSNKAKKNLFIALNIESVGSTLLLNQSMAISSETWLPLISWTPQRIINFFVNQVNGFKLHLARAIRYSSGWRSGLGNLNSSICFLIAGFVLGSSAICRRCSIPLISFSSSFGGTDLPLIGLLRQAMSAVLSIKVNFTQCSPLFSLDFSDDGYSTCGKSSGTKFTCLSTSFHSGPQYLPVPTPVPAGGYTLVFKSKPCFGTKVILSFLLFFINLFLQCLLMHFIVQLLKFKVNHYFLFFIKIYYSLKIHSE